MTFISIPDKRRLLNILLFTIAVLYGCQNILNGKLLNWMRSSAIEMRNNNFLPNTGALERNTAPPSDSVFLSNLVDEDGNADYSMNTQRHDVTQRVSSNVTGVRDPKCLYPQMTVNHPSIKKFLKYGEPHIKCKPMPYESVITAHLNYTGWLLITSIHEEISCFYRQIGGFMYPKTNE
jgi:hypothetical protein